MYLNDVKLIGKVRDDAALKILANGGAILNFTLITAESFKNFKSELVARKEEHRIVVFNGAAKKVAPCGKLLAGTEVLVEGFLRSHVHEFSGHLVTEVIARRVQQNQALELAPEDQMSEGLP